MIQQIDLYLKATDLSPLYSSPAVKLHGFIMSAIDTHYAGYIHKLEINPFSMYLYNNGSSFIMRLSALNSEAIQIIDAMEKIREIPVYGLNSPFAVEYKSRAAPLSIADIGHNTINHNYTVRFVTPAVYKISGRYCNLPVLYKLFKSVINKININEHLSLNEESLERLFSLVRLNSYRFESTSYRIESSVIPSILGYADITICADGEDLTLLQLLLGYAEYSGVGAKTSMGMGGFMIHKFLNNAEA